MLSRITIEVDFDNGNPYIRVINDKQSDDVRDKLVTHFRQKFAHLSCWCRVKFDSEGISTQGKALLEIHPIQPKDLNWESKEMSQMAEIAKTQYVMSEIHGD